jgi:uncharacterized membrane protein (Fun14 family)
LSADVISSISATLGGGFFGGLLFGYAIKKVVKLITVIAGLFIAGLAYLQYQQVAAFDWNRIEVLASAALGNVTTQINNSQEAIAFSMSNFGIPLSGSMSAGFAVGFMKG